MKTEPKKLSYRMLVFSEVLRCGSFTAAAEKLGHTKSAVSTYISQLEALLGIRLLNRSTRRLAPTAAGERFARHCHTLSDVMQLAVEEIKAFERVPSGRLVVTAPHAFEETVIAPVIGQLCQCYPEIMPELVFSDERLDLLENKLDLAVTVGDLPDSAYHAVKIGTLDSVLVAAPELLQRQPLNHIDQLQSVAKVMPSWQRDFQLREVSSGRQKTITGASKTVVNTLSSAMILTTMGLGVALVPLPFVQAFLRSGKLLRVLPGWQGIRRPVYAVHPYQRQPPLVLKYLIDSLRAQLAKSS